MDVGVHQSAPSVGVTSSSTTFGFHRTVSWTCVRYFALVNTLMGKQMLERRLSFMGGTSPRMFAHESTGEIDTSKAAALFFGVSILYPERSSMLSAPGTTSPPSSSPSGW